MGAARFLIARTLARRWKRWVAIAVVIAIVWSVALVAVAGARRTRTSYARNEAAGFGHDVEVQAYEDLPRSTLDDVMGLPQVARAGLVHFVPAGVTEPGRALDAFSWNVSVIAAGDEEIFRTVDVPRLVAGRFADPSVPLEAMVSPDFVAERGLGIGDEVTFQMPTMRELYRLFAGRNPPATGPIVTVTIVGVWRIPSDVALDPGLGGYLMVGPAFAQRYGSGVGLLDILEVRLHGGEASLPAFREAARAAAGGRDVFDFISARDTAAGVTDALVTQAAALWVFGGLVALAALILIGQAIARTIADHQDDLETLRALGASPAALRAAVSGPPLVSIVVGGALAVGCSLLGSVAMPVGLARSIEPSPGISFDPLILVGGAGVLIGLFWIRVGLSAWGTVRRSRREARARARPSRIAARLARAGFPASTVAGVRFALEAGHGRRAVPTRSALGGAIVGVAAVVTTLIFGQTFDQVLEQPARYGWNWDLNAPGGESAAVVAEGARKLASMPEVAEFSSVSEYLVTRADGGRAAATVFTPYQGDVGPVVLSGRLPVARDEVALGNAIPAPNGRLVLEGTRRECGGVAGCAVAFRVVGNVIGYSSEQKPAEGVVLTAEGAARLRHSNGFTDFLLRFAPGVGRERGIAAVEERFGDSMAPRIPKSLENLARVRSMPQALSVVVGVLALGLLAHLTVTSVRRRRRDLAVLKVMGFRAGQLRVTVASQASTVLVIALLIGGPAGVIAGRVIWRVTASRLGVGPGVVIPWVVATVGAAGLLLVGNLIAAIPARIAARTQPAVVLRSE